MRIHGSELVTDSRQIGSLMVNREELTILGRIMPDELSGCADEMYAEFDAGAPVVDMALADSRLVVDAMQSFIFWKPRSAANAIIAYACELDENAESVYRLLTEGMPYDLNSKHKAAHVLGRAARIMRRPDMIVRHARTASSR